MSLNLQTGLNETAVPPLGFGGGLRGLPERGYYPVVMSANPVPGKIGVIEMGSGASAVLRCAGWLGRGFLTLVGALLVPSKPHDDRQLLDSDLIGEYNHRTGRLDAGNDPYGWYDED